MNLKEPACSKDVTLHWKKENGMKSPKEQSLEYMTCCAIGTGQQFRYIPSLLPILHRGPQKENISGTGEPVGYQSKWTPPLILTDLAFPLCWKPAITPDKQDPRNLQCTYTPRFPAMLFQS